MEIDQQKFDKQFNIFCQYVTRGKYSLQSFSENSIILEQEGYKESIYFEANEKLETSKWSISDIGTGKIFEKAVAAVYTRENNNNLIDWRIKGNFKNREEKLFYTDVSYFEETLFLLYTKDIDAEEAFTRLQRTFLRSYSLITFFMYLYSKDKYVPVGSPQTLDRGMRKLGIEFKLSHKASWQNYNNLLEILRGIQIFLEFKGINDVSLLDAHTFLWMISRNLTKEFEARAIDHQQTDNLDSLQIPLEKTKKALIAIRTSQDKFRKLLQRDRQLKCVVTGITEPVLIEAAHIKPFKECTPDEAINSANGLFMSVHIHRLFDAGLISFNTKGKIQISSKIDPNLLKELSIPKDIIIKLSKDSTRFVNYHFRRVFIV